MGSNPPSRFRQSLNDLPDELAEKIIAQLDTRTLYCCTLSSKRIYRISLRYLYRKITHCMYQEPPKLHTAIRTLIRRPELASEVETIVLRDPVQNESFWDLRSWKHWADESYDAALKRDDQASFLLAARALMDATPSKDDMLNREEAHAALLISLAPNLKTLYLENPTCEDETPRFVLDQLILKILHPKIREGAVLQNLRTLHAVTNRLESGQGGFRLSSIATFFHLPKLRTVTGVACFEPEDDLFRDFDCPVSTSNVAELKFVRSSICPIGVSQMLDSCAAIENLDCDWAGLSVGWVEINFPVLTDALLRHKDSLRSLRLDTRKHYDSWPERDDGLVPPLGEHLKQFTALTRLDVPASALMGWDENNVGGYGSIKDVLPPNIKELKINEWAPRVASALEGFAVVCEELYPSLTRLTVSREQMVGAEEDSGTLAKLMVLFRNHAPRVSVSFEDGSEIDHFEGSMDGSI